MPQYDLAGNPLPEAPAPAAPPVRYDLAGNPLPSAAPGSAPPPSLPPLSALPGPGSAYPGIHFSGAPLPGPSGPAFGGVAPSQDAAPRVGLYVGLAAAAVVLLALIFVLRAAKPVLIAAPTAYTSYMAVDKSFTCDQPTGWDRTISGVDGGNAAGVIFRRGGARVMVGNDLAGSLMGDMMTSANNQTDNLSSMTGQAAPPPTPPVEKLHEAEAKNMAARYSDYDELPMQPLSSPVGDARLSEWTATGGLMEGKLHGYRVTILGNERRFLIVCQCPERNWAVLRPAFLHIIGSVAPGSN